MGTRGFIGFLKAGTPELRGSYNHFDSYPTGLGADLQKQLRAQLEAAGNADPLSPVPALWARIIAAAARIRWVEQDDEPTAEEQAQYAHLWQEVSTGRDWYSLLREAQGKLDFMLLNGIAVANHDFPRDSLFCEWGYVLDLSKCEVVILRGFNNDPGRQAPYCKTSDEEITRQSKEEGSVYYGCYEKWRGTLEAFLALDMEAMETKEEEEEAEA